MDSPSAAKIRAFGLLMSGGEIATGLNAGFGGVLEVRGVEGAFRASALASAQKRLFVRAGSKSGAVNGHRRAALSDDFIHVHYQARNLSWHTTATIVIDETVFCVESRPTSATNIGKNGFPIK